MLSRLLWFSNLPALIIGAALAGLVLLVLAGMLLCGVIL